MKKLLLILLLASFSSCTDNSRARMMGGSETIVLRPGYKFINATWKEHDLWIIAFDSTTGNHVIYEKSNFGLLEGQILIKNKP